MMRKRTIAVITAFVILAASALIFLVAPRAQVVGAPPGAEIMSPSLIKSIEPIKHLITQEQKEEFNDLVVSDVWGKNFTSSVTFCRNECELISLFGIQNFLYKVLFQDNKDYIQHFINSAYEYTEKIISGEAGI